MKTYAPISTSHYSNENSQESSNKANAGNYAFLIGFANSLRNFHSLKTSYKEIKGQIIDQFGPRVFIKGFSFALCLIWILIIISTVF